MSGNIEIPSPGKLVCLHGASGVFQFSLYAASKALLRGLPIAVVDGSNMFDAYYIAEFARRVTSERLLPHSVTPEQLLKRIFVARAFTCYQMEATITERLPAFLKRKDASIAVIFGLLDTFYDEQAPLFEAKAGVDRMIIALRALKQENTSVLLVSKDMKLASKERNSLMPKVMAAMDEVFVIPEKTDARTLHHRSYITQ